MGAFIQVYYYHSYPHFYLDYLITSFSHLILTHIADDIWYSHPWDRVSLASWIKYPNELAPHVIHVDYLSRYLDPSTGILHTERLVTCQQKVPSFIARLFGSSNDEGDYALFHESSQVDPKSGILILQTTNLSFRDLIVVEETCKYFPHSTDLSQTVLHQEARVMACLGGFTHIKNVIEEFCVSRFCVNAKRGKAALENVLERLSLKKEENSQ